MAVKKQAAKPAPSAAKPVKAKKPAARPAAPAAAKPAPKKTAPAKRPQPPVKAAAPVPKPAAPVKPPPPKAAAAPKAEPPTRPVIAEGVRRTAPAAAPRAADHAEESESSESLLAGPRNVKPYVQKRGEQYMSTEQLEHFRTILQNWKQDLMLEVDRTVSHMKDEAANFPDPNDRATQEEEFSLELRTRDRERKLIRKIDEALGRIEDGSYGYCLETGEQIGVKRLEARPVATLSLEAQERRERREKQYGDRDDRYR
jgi:DnaK suppressor protein